MFPPPKRRLIRTAIVVLVFTSLAPAADTVAKYVARGHALAERKNWDGGIAEYRRALEINPKAAAVPYNLANALRAKVIHWRPPRNTVPAWRSTPRAPPPTTTWAYR